MKHRKRSNRMHRLRVVSGLLTIAVLVGAFVFVPSPFDRSAERSRQDLEGRIDRLEQELGEARAALEDEITIRAALDEEIDGLVTELTVAYETRYQAIVDAFAHAADIACAGDTTDGESGLSDVARAAECNARDLHGMAQDLANQPVVCGVLPVEALDGVDLDRCVMLYAHSNEVRVDSLAVTSSAGEGLAVILGTSAPVDAGDTLDVSAYFRVTNELPANVGVAGHLWAYDLDGDRSVQWRIGPSNGDNVDRQRHHMPVALQTVYSVPDTWPDGHRMAVVLKADAHSTATNGDLEVDPNGNLVVRITKG